MENNNEEPINIENVNKNVEYFKSLIKNLEEKAQKQSKKLNETMSYLNQCKRDLEYLRETQIKYLFQWLNEEKKSDKVLSKSDKDDRTNKNEKKI